MVSTAYEANDEEAWSWAHRVAAMLRGPVVATCRGSVIEHAVRRPDLVHIWKLDIAKRIKITGNSLVKVDGASAHVLLGKPIDPPRVTLATIREHANTWESWPLATADEVVANVKRLEADGTCMVWW